MGGFVAVIAAQGDAGVHRLNQTISLKIMLMQSRWDTVTCVSAQGKGERQKSREKIVRHTLTHKQTKWVSYLKVTLKQCSRTIKYSNCRHLANIKRLKVENHETFLQTKLNIKGNKI